MKVRIYHKDEELIIEIEEYEERDGHVDILDGYIDGESEYDFEEVVDVHHEVIERHILNALEDDRVEAIVDRYYADHF